MQKRHDFSLLSCHWVVPVLSFQFLAQSEKKNLEREIARSLLSPGFHILSAPLSGARPDVKSYILKGTWEGKLGKYMSVALRDF